jgi:hypothetical protein
MGVSDPIFSITDLHKFSFALVIHTLVYRQSSVKVYILMYNLYGQSKPASFDT